MTVGITVMAVVAWFFSWMSRTAWVWWLAPLTVVLEGSPLFRPGKRGDAAVLSPSELPVVGEVGVPTYFVSAGVTTSVAAWGAYTGNRFALIIGAACAILGTALHRFDLLTWEYTASAPNYAAQSVSSALPGAIAFRRR